MKYSDAFDKLYALTLEAPFDIRLFMKPRYKRVGVYIWNVMIVDHATFRERLLSEDVELYDGKKDIMIEHFCGITDSEWDTLQTVMLDYAENYSGTSRWKGWRVGWIRALDTLRAFS
jgi:hypothetical protein